jgi:hypothetical protein
MSLHTYLYVVDGWFLFSYFMAEEKCCIYIEQFLYFGKWLK